ncbi:MAG: hypothetical protein K1Y36_24985 [Blastocatellia bacterium]|nr:hypothetical protein [Blastocatellia bacterium]
MTPSQPMVTKTGRANLFDIHHVAVELAGQLQAEGFPVIRTKIEIPGESRRVPQTADEARNIDRARYFEQHVKVLLSPESEGSALLRLAQKHNAHLSRNALRVRADHKEERFLTQRCFGVGQPEAMTRFAAFVREIEELGFLIIKTEAEFVLFDSNLALDTGWTQGKE